MAVKRLLVSLDQELLTTITAIAKSNNQSISEIARDLMHASIDLREDEGLASLAEARLESTEEWISHQDAWH